MKNNYITLVAVLLLSTTISFAQQTVWVDFGSSHADWITGGNYNNYHYQNAVNYSAILVNDSGANTPFTMTFTDLFIDRNASGSTAPSGDAASFDVKATKDSLFGSSGHGGIDDQLGAFEITGLDDSKFYTFEVFACRAGVSGTRSAKYEFVGASTKSGVLNASSNNANTVVIYNVQPTGGKITFNTTPDASNDHSAKYFYLGAMKLTESVTALSINDEILAANGVKVYPNPIKKSLSISYILHQENKTSISIFDITGRLIFSSKNGSNQAGTYTFTWNRRNNQGGKVSTGLYFLEFKIGSRKLIRKIVVE